ncbi:TetR/AcrR family transcriptional regulator [Sphingomonas naphthae]|uniref:TetR/AcrR family transcriptional regulator n=1 Tax=Sphingomonas naphthae TaxID=1813468 RepID=A0ABY7TQH9_9SPHN|nr:TetR/AcrR family transcriptional regulator [Sphingomonas naphthae]WCT74429.1 TetR/AcrR family transcriptional regulator [Sphingomonas naphthae]
MTKHIEPPRKRVRRDPETARQLILDATEQLMVDEGYAAVSSRRVAKAVGINSALVHYYFPTADDLFIALHRRMTERHSAKLADLATAEDPLRALWQFQTHWAQTTLGVEFIALANHRKAIRAEIAERTEQARAVQAEALARSLARDGPIPCPPLGMATLLVAISRTLANEEAIGITSGHAEVRAMVEWAMAHLPPPPPTD